MKRDDYADIALPDRPYQWSGDEFLEDMGFRQSWVPGAFGDRQTIEDVWAYRVIEGDWQHVEGTDEELLVIKKAEIVELFEP